ncbi:hypothetical protein BC829DRAFT_486088 [Chytridium lagenaria]|nr:hypothetical protein BC829DRAFT_486088 [Chytridium lagenaria]
MDSLQKLLHTLQEICETPTSKSVLILGERGSGKSFYVRKAMQDLRTKPGSAFHEIWLTGLYHTDPKIAIKDMARQLQLHISEDDLETLQPHDCLTHLLRSSTNALNHKLRFIIFLEEFELFASQMNQVFVYTLLDGVKNGLHHLSVRVKSRFSHNTIYLPAVVDVDKASSCGRISKFEAFLRENMKESEHALVEGARPPYESKLPRSTASQYFQQVELTSLALSSQSRITSLDNSFSSVSRSLDKDLSLLELCLLTVIQKNITALKPVNFNIVFDQTQRLFSQKLGFMTRQHAALFKAYHRLLVKEIIAPDDGRGPFSVRDGFVKVLVALSDLEEVLESGIQHGIHF